MTYSSVRTTITPKTVNQALWFAARAKDSRDVHDFFDIQQRYLQLRQCGRSVSWLVRAKRQSRKIGSALPSLFDPSHLSLKDARQRAGEAYFGMAPPFACPAVGWTWAELDRHYQEMLTQRRKRGRRIKPASPSTQDDVRLCFSKPEFKGWQALRLTDLTPRHLTELIGAVHNARGHRSAEKTLAYVKAALTWAQSEKSIDSGLAERMP
jgi:hypothetical protein